MTRKWVFTASIVSIVLISATIYLKPRIIKGRQAPVADVSDVLIQNEISTSSAVLDFSTTSSKVITHGNISKKDIIFTFDGGGTIQSGQKILEVLAKHHVKGTFFLTGKMVIAHPDLVKEIAAAGHEIFSHTYDHPDLTKLPDNKITDEFTKFATVLEATVGISPKPYFRAPYGSQNARVIATAEAAGYESVFWTVDARDWMQNRETDASVKARILSSLAPGNIYLMHVGDTITGDILDSVFTTIESKGYRIVSLTQGL